MDWFSRSLSRSDIESLIESWIFSERDRHILHRRLIDGVHIEALACEFDLSVSQVKRILARGKETLVSQCW